MMREILFRGKRVSNGEWVEGGIMPAFHPNFDSESKEDFVLQKGNCYCICANGKDYFVEQNSIGQYTGLKDKNGKRVFEGDIVEFYFYDKEHKNTKTMRIEWRNSGFCMRELFRNYRLAENFSIISEKIFTYRGDIRDGVYASNDTYFIEVIGNIHDNPELLEGGAE